jgi:peptide deformylase
VTIRELRLLGDPVLRTECDPVTRFDNAVGRLIDDLMENVLLPGRAGLAANQIGVSLAAFSYNVDGQHGYVLNPVIVETSGEYDGPEGCLSVPGVTADTMRAMRTVVTGVDRRGDPVTVEGTAEMSRCLQHETDHLHGVLYLDRLTGPQRKEVLGELRRGGGPRGRWPADAAVAPVCQPWDHDGLARRRGGPPGDDLPGSGVRGAASALVRAGVPAARLGV